MDAMKKITNFARRNATHQMTAVSIPPTASAAAFAEYMRQAGRRCTPERFLVLSAAESLQGHFTARVVADVLQRNSTHVSMATVYSTMQMLVDCGMLRKLYIDNAATVYEMSMACHKHLVCTKCGKIKKLKDPEFDEMLRKRRFSAFTPAYATVSVYGVCSTCARKTRKATTEQKKQSKSVISKNKK